MATSNHALLETIISSWKTQVLRAACRLRLFDALELDTGGKNDGGMKVEPLAKQLHCHSEKLGRLLRALAGLGILHYDEGLFCNTESSRLHLTSSSPDSILASMDLLPDASHCTHENLVRSVSKDAEGAGTLNNVVATHPGKVETFHSLIQWTALPTSELKALFKNVKDDFSQVQTIVDLGGGVGFKTERIQRLFPDKKITVIDLPEVVEKGKQYASEKGGMYRRLEFKEGNFFEESLPLADCYILINVIHAWDDYKVCTILQNVHAALPSGGMLLIMEKAIDENELGPWSALALDMCLLAFGASGKERTGYQYQMLLAAGGFQGVRIYRSEKWIIGDLICATK